MIVYFIGVRSVICLNAVQGRHTYVDRSAMGNSKTKDGVSRHPSNSEACKTFDALYVYFSADPQNARLVLSIYGFEMFRHEANHSI